MRDARRRPVAGLVAAAAATLFLVVACGSDGDSGGDRDGGSEVTPTQADLDGSTFTATSKTGSGLVTDSTITLSFDHGTMAVNADCNTQSAVYDVEDGTLKWTSPPAATLKACPPELEAQDARLSRLFTDGVTASLDGTTLTLTNADQGVTLVLEGT